MARALDIAPGEYYHIFNRGVQKRDIFLDRRDYARFLFLVLYFQSPIGFENLGRPVSHFVEHSVFNISGMIEDNIIRHRYVSLVCFALARNHFHLLLKCDQENGVSKYMQRTLNSFTKYFNTRYNQNGHLLQGPYRAVHVESNEQLLYLSAYIHKHPRESWKRSLMYPWSSLQDYCGDNRWGGLIDGTPILDQFNDAGDYYTWVKDSPAKEPEYLADDGVWSEHSTRC